MFLLEGYDLQQLREQHANKRVFDGVRASDQQSVCVHDYQFGRAGHPHLPRIKSSLQGLQALLSPYLVDICQLLFREESVVVVMAEGGRPSLQSLLRDGKRFSLAQVLDIIERISAGLEVMHAKKLLHQELTPENIYLNTDGSEAKLGGFGVLRDCEQPAQLAPLERLLYLSPEHSGRMNRTIDSRSDLYSLGVVCYQLLSGEPPFQADDSLALIHAHMAQPAKVLHSVNRAIPRVVSDIVHKLLSKEAEHRYQSASGLNADIRACLQQLEEGAEITQHFEVGSLDTLSRFQIPEKLYGRHAEVQQLLNVFTRSANGHFEVVRVGGYSGVGKSALINEIQKTIVARRGIYVAGKYQQFKKSQPHSAILQVLADMVRQVLVKPQNEIDEWLSNLLPRLKGEGQCLIEVLPILQSLIGEQPPVPELNSVETLARFNRCCEALIRAFSAYTHPLIIFLDDLQWADLASLNLIEHLLGCNIPYCMLIMAYRDNEVDSHHPFSVLLHKQQEQGQAMAEIALQALSLADVQQIVADTLHQKLADIMPLAQELMAKTQGNPFYLIQLFSALQQEGHIVFRAEQGWSWHMAGIRQASLSGGVVALMSRKIKKYPQGTQDMLNMCAIQGAEFTLGMSALVLGQAIDAAYQAVLPAIEDGLIQSWGECFKFAHDKIQESCYALCSAQACNQRHWQVAQQMLNGLDEAAIEGEIFAIVTHLNHGSEQLADDQQRVDIAGFNYRAGIAAQQASAFGPALSYFKQSKTYLSDEIWQQQPGFAFELHFALAQVAYTCSQFELAEETIKLCMHHEDEQVTITPVVQLYLDLLFSCSRHAEGIAFGLAKLREYGQSLPAKPGKLAVMREYLAFKCRQRWRSTPSLLHLAASKDAKILSVMAILSSLVPSCYMVDGELMGIVSLRMANLSLRHGNNLYSSFGYAMTGMVEIGPLKRLRSGRQYCDLSWAMEEKYP
ncbi:MAG: AAA family ATPase, partial [Bermanella sp.]